MTSKPSLSIKVLAGYLITDQAVSQFTASDSALDHMIAHGDALTVLNATGFTAEGRERFIRNVLKLIEHDPRAPISKSINRLEWLVPAMEQDQSSVQVDNNTSSKKEREVLLEGMAAIAGMQDDFGAQIRLLKLSNALSPAAHRFAKSYRRTPRSKASRRSDSPAS